MSNEKRTVAEPTAKRGLGSDIALSVVSGASGGVAGAVATQVMSKLPSKKATERK